MRVLLVVESIFGNTRRIADAIASGIGSTAQVQVVDVEDAPTALDGVDLLVVGGPTHAFGLTSEASRRTAADQSGHAVPVAAIGLRDWLARIASARGSAPVPEPSAAAAFDTRMNVLRLPGSAAAKAARRLRRAGFHIVARPKTFRVVGTEGPLREGELDRAAEWGATLVRRASPVPSR
ncbi:flavodoxin [Actinomycetes bacterium KLBMP 9759]